MLFTQTLFHATIMSIAVPPHYGNDNKLLQVVFEAEIPFSCLEYLFIIVRNIRPPVAK